MSERDRHGQRFDLGWGSICNESVDGIRVWALISALTQWNNTGIFHVTNATCE